MVATATLYEEGPVILQIAPTGGYSSGQVMQLPDGRAGVVLGLKGPSVNDAFGCATDGIFNIPKTASINILDGQEVFLDHSAGTATYTAAGNDRDFYVGVAVGDSLAAATTVNVNLNVRQSRIIDLQTSSFDTVVVKTVVGSTTVEVPQVFQRGGASILTFGTTAEAQKVDMLSQRSFPITSKWIAEFIFNVVVAADAAAGDISIGLANGTHATDADAITDSVFVHLDGGSANIYLESDDTTANEVAATDSTIDFTAGTPVHVVMDGRNEADIQIYINGVLMLASTVFTLAGATGPLKMLIHAEKTSDDSPLTLAMNKGTVRTMQQSNAA